FLCGSLLRRRFIGFIGLGGGQFRHAERSAHLVLDLARQFRTLLQIVARIVLALADTVAAVAVPGAGFLDDLVVGAQIENLAFARRAFSIQNVEMRFAERRRNLVLDNLDARFVADHFVARLDGTGTADIEADGCVEFQRVTAGRGFRVAEHDADLHTNLVDEDNQRIGTIDAAGQLAQRLRHQARLQTWQRIAHVALDFGFRRQRGDRVDDDQIDTAGAHQRVANFQRLFAGVRLRNQQLGHIDAEFLGISGVQCVFGVDEGAGTAKLLHLGNRLQRQRRFTGRFRAVDFDNAAARQTADAECDVQAQRTGRNDLHFLDHGAVFHAHDRTFTELLFDLRQRGGQCFALFSVLCEFLVVHEILSAVKWIGRLHDVPGPQTALYKKTVLYA